MYETEGSFVTRFWPSTDLLAEWDEDGFKVVIVSVENSTNEFFSLYWESKGRKHILEIPYDRFKLACSEVGDNILDSLSETVTEETK